MDKTTWSHNDNTSAATLLSAELGYGRRGVCYPFYSTYPASVIGGEPIDIIDIKSVGVSGQTPGWQQLLAEGELLPVTEYSVSRQFAVQQPAIHSENCYNLGGSGRYTQSGTAFAYTQLTVTSNPNCTVPNLDALLQAAHAEAQSLGWDVLVDLAESPETYQLFAKYVKLFRDRRAFIQKLTRKGLRDPKTGRYTRINNLSKSARARIAEREFLNHWMESRYAWRPLVFSSEAIIEAINTWREPVAELVKVRKSQTETASSPATFSGLYRTITENVPWPTETTDRKSVV